MPSTSLEADKVFEELVQEFPPEIEKLAKEFRAFARARKIKTVAQLLRIVLLYSGLDKSLREVAANVTTTIEKISDTAIAKRLIAAQAWVKAILPQMIDLPKIDGLSQRRIIVVDGSCVESPGATGTEYRLHIALNLLTLEIVDLLVADKNTSEKLTNFHFHAGDIIIGDRAYGKKQEIIKCHEQGCDLLIRCYSLLPLTNPTTGQQIDLVKQLRGKARLGSDSFAVEIKCEKSNRAVSAWVHAVKLPAKQSAKARRKINAQAKKKKRNTRASTLFLAGWLVVITTLPPGEFSTEMILQLYRCRWQVELVIKRFKSVLDVDLLRAHFGSPLAQVWLNGKMLYVLMIERRAKRKCKYCQDSFSLDSERTLTDWRLWKMIIDEVAPMITLAQFWPTQFSAATIRALAERPRRRKLQTIPGDLRLSLSPFIQPIKPAVLAA